MLNFVISINRVAKANTIDLDLVGSDLTIENPLGLYARVPRSGQVLLEQTNRIGDVAGREVGTIFGNDQVLNGMSAAIVIGDFQGTREFLVMMSDRVNNFDHTIALTNEQLRTIRSEF